MKSTRRQPLIVWWLLAPTLFLATVGTGFVLAGSSSMTAVETSAVVAVNSVHSPALDAIALSINVVFGPSFAVLIAAIGIGAAGAISRSWIAALKMATLVVVPWGLADLVKIIVQRPRPDMSVLAHPVLVEPSTFSYPSGHTAFAAALGTGVLMMLAGRRYRRTSVTLVVVVAIVTAWSRVYLGAHFPSDVLASLLLVPLLSICVSALWNRTRLAAGGAPVRKSDQHPDHGGFLEDATRTTEPKEDRWP
ncbi:Putative undecaprenyl-diphosphatase YbjG [Microbacterium oxydans]|uniref:phosphatase PAP2 family protein n=1 Tax=Microbacterium oxydans TaxID=82380 RepID=UPI001D240F51|nr:phosphatase PAP2 family protein [Microbacterium oxydans]CAH0231297.1 Putative undecaprenyl-diphosphatase YbjG [Microbacterium oxydans]